MRVMGKDKANEFLARHRHACWCGDLRAFLCELANRTWADAQDLMRDYPDMRLERSGAVFPISGARILVFCQINLERGLILLQRLVLARSGAAGREASEDAA